MKVTYLILLLLLSSLALQAQSTHDFLVGGGWDLIKTDNNKLFDKAQIGLEANYFLQRHFALGAGAEIWTRQRNSFVMGVRWYANENVFVRFRGLIGANDAALGVGYAKPLTTSWRLEVIGDYYFNTAQFGLRGGIAYVIRRK